MYNKYNLNYFLFTKLQTKNKIEIWFRIFIINFYLLVLSILGKRKFRTTRWKFDWLFVASSGLYRLNKVFYLELMCFASLLYILKAKIVILNKMLVFESLVELMINSKIGCQDSVFFLHLSMNFIKKRNNFFMFIFIYWRIHTIIYRDYAWPWRQL